MSAKYTPGPWLLVTGSQFDQENPSLDGFAVGYAEVGISTVTIRAVGQTMTPCPSLEVLEQIGLANANLMAAAPDLLEALETLLGALCETPDGRSSVLRHVPMAMDMARAAIAKAKGGAA